MSELRRLAERCEKATGPDIGAELTLVHLEDEVKRAVWDLFHLPPRPFLHSIDAAMTLVPEGWTYRLSSAPHRKGHAADLWPPIEPGKGPFVRRADAPTPALALCAAALRAREEVSNV